MTNVVNLIVTGPPNSQYVQINQAIVDLKTQVDEGFQSAITQTLSDGDTTHAPSSDVVFDALAGKASVNYTPVGTGSQTRPLTARLGDRVSILDFWDGGDNFSTACQKALATMRRVWVPKSVTAYTITQSININGDQSLEFEGRGQVVNCTVTPFIFGSASNYEQNMAVIGNGTIMNFKTASAGQGLALFLSSVGRQSRFILQGFRTLNASFLIKQDADLQNGFFFDCEFRDLKSYCPRGAVVQVTNPQGFVLLDRVIEDRTYNDFLDQPTPNVYNITWFAFQIATARVGLANMGAGIQIRGETGVFGFGFGGDGFSNPNSTATAGGFYIRNQLSMTVENGLADSITGPGVDADTYDNCKFEFEAYASIAGGVKLVNGTRSDYSLFRTQGFGGTYKGIQIINDSGSNAGRLIARSWLDDQITLDGVNRCTYQLCSARHAYAESPPGTPVNTGAAGVVVKSTIAGNTTQSMIGMIIGSYNADYQYKEMTPNQAMRVTALCCDTAVILKNYYLTSNVSVVEGITQGNGTLDLHKSGTNTPGSVIA